MKKLNLLCVSVEKNSIFHYTKLQTSSFNLQQKAGCGYCSGSVCLGDPPGDNLVRDQTGSRCFWCGVEGTTDGDPRLGEGDIGGRRQEKEAAQDYADSRQDHSW